jgi:NADH-quinone oxidoreductase subunit G
MAHAHLIQLHQHYLLGQVHKLSTEVSEMITVVIDGFEVTVPKGTLVIRAAEQLG